MEQPFREKLQQLGLDIEFLAWLEGETDRLPRMDRVRKIKGEDFAAALRAVVWLTQHFGEPELISPSRPEEWLERYDVLERFLHGALAYSTMYHTLSVPKDLAALELVLEELLPASSWDQYHADIVHLRKAGRPLRLPHMPSKASGGKPQSEQTMRMRAAVKCVSGVSKTPYIDLANFWNEWLGYVKYQPEQIKDRLRKGHAMSKKEGAARHVLDLWRSAYEGAFRTMFSGPFPLSRELSKRVKQ